MAVNTEPLLILASASPRRKELLECLDLPFTVIAADIDETKQASETPSGYCHRMAYEKALAIQSDCASAWILGADTSVVLGDIVLGKPTNQEDAAAMLRQLSGKTHHVITSVCLLSPNDKAEQEMVSKVIFDELNDRQIQAYCDTNQPYDKAGAYGIQGLAGVFVKRIEGDYSAIMGLPLNATWGLLGPYRIATAK